MESKLRLNGKGTVRFLVIFSFFVWIWWFFRSYVLVVALAVILGCVAASGLLLWLGREGFRAEVILPKGRVGRGAAFPLQIRVHNPMKLVGFTADVRYRWGNVFTDYFQTKEEHLWVMPEKGTCSRQSLESRFAGRLDVQIERFQVYDLFHIFCLKGCDTQDAWVVAYPTPSFSQEEDIKDQVEGFPQEDECKKRGMDYNPDYEIRGYIPGDELKSIHWKLTAKQNRLMVRERLASGKQKINVVLPLGEDKVQNDQLMNALYSLCLLLLDKEYPMQLFWPGKEMGLRSRYLAEQGELEGVVAEILSSCGLNLSGNIQAQMGTEYPGTSYILIQTGAYKGAYIQ